MYEITHIVDLTAYLFIIVCDTDMHIFIYSDSGCINYVFQYTFKLSS